MAGSWSNSYQTSLTLPTGATSGARIVLDGTTDTILVYDETGALVASMAANQGTDGFGNTVLEGVTAYAGGEYVQMDTGTLHLGTPLPGDSPGSIGIIGDSSAISIESAGNTTLPEKSLLIYRAGASGSATGDATYPHLELDGTQTGADAWIRGSLLAGIIPAGSGTMQPETWHSPGMATDWTNISLKYRLDPMDNVVWNGLISYTGAAVTAAGSASVLSAVVPAAYRPGAQCRVTVAHFTSTGFVKNTSAAFQFTTAGGLTVLWGDGVAGSAHDVNGLATGDRFEIYASIPLGHLK